MEKGPLTVECLDRPGLRYSEERLSELVTELRSVAAECFQPIPIYQCLSGKRDELARSLIAIARDAEGKMIGFCASILFEEQPGGTRFLHLGLTCIRPKARSLGLTHKLTTRVVTHALLRHSTFGRISISNVACVLSSLGNVALHFEDIYPSPFGETTAKPYQRKIAQLISEKYRPQIAVRDQAKFDLAAFVFRESVQGPPFQKSGTDSNYHHRAPAINTFYSGLISFERGDEVLQVGRVSFLSYPRYLLKKWRLL